jgi:uncharacterized membrane protein YagU involved in acid resistance
MNLRRAVLAGLAATLAMTLLWLVEARLDLGTLAFGDILSSLLAVATAYASLGPAMGWILHFGVGALLAVLYAAVFAARLPGPPFRKGLAYGGMIFVLAQVVFMPLVGSGVFSHGDRGMLLGSLIGHLVYGGLVGAIYGYPAPVPDRT